MYRDNQDLDIVVTRADGGTESEGQIEEFQKEVARLFPYFRGKNSKWEVRGLKNPRTARKRLCWEIRISCASIRTHIRRDSSS